MSKDIIEIKFKWSKELAIKASKLYYDWDMKNSSKRYIGWFFVALTQFAIVGALKHNVFGLLYISTFLVLYWYYGRWYLRKRMIIKFYNNSNLDNTEVVFKLVDDGILYNNNLIDWQNIEKVIKFDDGVLLHTTSNTLFFAKDAFKNFNSFKKFLDKMKEKKKL